MSRKEGRKQEVKAKEMIIPKEEVPVPQNQFSQQYAQLQAMLMLTQLNSAYFKMHLTIVKNFSALENKYHSLKITVFMRLENFKEHVYEARTRLNRFNSCEAVETNSILCDPSLVNDANFTLKLKNKPSFVTTSTISATKTMAYLKSKGILKKMIKILSNKLENVFCSTFYLLLKNSSENSTIKILSDKSSKIQTIDSHKSKVFQRSVERRASRKSFSLEKSIKNNKNQYFVPIKYQAQNKASTPPILSNQTSIIQQSNIEDGCMTDFTKFLQKNHDPLLLDRRNLLSANRQRKILKSTSSKKINVSVLVYGKEEKIRELQYLERKYKKLIAEFNWFSERFLKVIQEETI